MKETYFVIRNSDGDTIVNTITKEELLERIRDGNYPNIFNTMPVDGDTNYWGDNILIIKGKIVVPEAKQVVTEYDIE